MKNKKRMAVVLILLAIAIGVLLCTMIILPQVELMRRESISGKMERLSDSIKANPEDTNALQSLIRSLNSKDSFEKTKAAIYLGKVRERAKPAVGPLVNVLSGDDPYAAREAAMALGEIGPGAKAAIPALINAIKNHPNQDIGAFAARSLGFIADPNDATVAIALKNVMESNNDFLKGDADLALKELEERRKVKDVTNALP